MPEPDGPGIGLPFLIRVMWSPGRAPVSQASSTEPFPRSAATLTGLAVPATLRPTPTIAEATTTMTTTTTATRFLLCIPVPPVPVGPLYGNGPTRSWHRRVSDASPWAGSSLGP